MSTVCCRLTARTSSLGATRRRPADTSGPRRAFQPGAERRQAGLDDQPDLGPLTRRKLREERQLELHTAERLPGERRGSLPHLALGPGRAGRQLRHGLKYGPGQGSRAQAPTDPCFLLPGPLGSQ